MSMRRVVVALLLSLAIAGCDGQRTDTPAPTPQPPPTPATGVNVVHLCPVCKQDVPAEAKYCRRCGSRLR